MSQTIVEYYYAEGSLSPAYISSSIVPGTGTNNFIFVYEDSLYNPYVLSYDSNNPTSPAFFPISAVVNLGSPDGERILLPTDVIFVNAIYQNTLDSREIVFTLAAADFNNNVSGYLNIANGILTITPQSSSATIFTATVADTTNYLAYNFLVCGVNYNLTTNSQPFNTYIYSNLNNLFQVTQIPFPTVRLVPLTMYQYPSTNTGPGGSCQTIGLQPHDSSPGTSISTILSYEIYISAYRAGVNPNTITTNYPALQPPLRSDSSPSLPSLFSTNQDCIYNVFYQYCQQGLGCSGLTNCPTIALPSSCVCSASTNYICSEDSTNYSNLNITCAGDWELSNLPSDAELGSLPITNGTATGSGPINILMGLPSAPLSSTSMNLTDETNTSCPAVTIGFTSCPQIDSCVPYDNSGNLCTTTNSNCQNDYQFSSLITPTLLSSGSSWAWSNPPPAQQCTCTGSTQNLCVPTSGGTQSVDISCTGSWTIKLQSGFSIGKQTGNYTSSGAGTISLNIPPGSEGTTVNLALVDNTGACSESSIVVNWSDDCPGAGGLHWYQKPWVIGLIILFVIILILVVGFVIFITFRRRRAKIVTS